jgi:oxygen-independent coproporphyrinogen-3 oxidase
MKPVSDHSLSIYLHIPFCAVKCSYCAFNTYTQLDHLIPAFVNAVQTELRLVGEGNPYPSVHTIFFGGGTPSLLSPAHFEALLATLHEYFPLTDDAEITTEANPDDLTTEYLRDLHTLGINRLSIGMQSSNVRELALFERRHDQARVVSAVESARAAGFGNINLDLIYGAPHQTLVTWDDTLSQALDLAPEHLSLYALGLEDGTALDAWVKRGNVPQPDDDLAADMYDLATERLSEYMQYEISNWARPGYECRHNLQYWRNHPYIGVGPGAHGFAAGVRYATLLSPQRYIKALRTAQDIHPFPLTPAVQDAHHLNLDDELSETLITTLRLVQEGVGLADFRERFGFDLTDRYRASLERFRAQGLLEVTPEQVRLTREGRLLSNVVLREFV